MRMRRSWDRDCIHCIHWRREIDICMVVLFNETCMYLVLMNNCISFFILLLSRLKGRVEAIHQGRLSPGLLPH